MEKNPNVVSSLIDNCNWMFPPGLEFILMVHFSNFPTTFVLVDC